MKKIKLVVVLFITVIAITKTNAQSNFQLNGFLQYLETVSMQNFNEQWVTYSTINNRIDLRWYPNSNLTAHIGLRNIFDYGEMVTTIPQYSELVTKDDGYLNLTKKLSSGRSYLLYSNIDRLYLNYVNNNLEITAGRQRVNWGVNLVWTPNDIFNSFSYLNFDYVERPGSDAIKVQYYSSTTSSAQLVAKINRNNAVTAAAMYRFNKSNFDYQFLLGVMDNDYTLGGGWSGDVAGAGFNGEVNYFHNKNNFSDTTGILVVSLGINYTFPSSLYLHTAFLYNGNGKTGKAGGINLWNSQNFSAKNLSLGKYEFFIQSTYQFTPLVTGNFAAMLNSSDGSFFLGPNVDISLKNDLYLLVMTQLFFGQSETEFGDLGYYGFLRLKWNF